MCTSFKSNCIVGAIAAHGHAISDLDQMLDKLGFLLWTHARVDRAVDEHFFQDLRERTSQDGERVACHGEVIRVLSWTYVYHCLYILEKNSNEYKVF